MIKPSQFPKVLGWMMLFAAGVIHAANITVSMSGFQFVPKNQTINLGDTVTWVNRDGAQHDTTSGVNRVPNGIWRSPLFGNGGSFSFTFNNAGIFSYYCTPHALPPFNMTGSITVVVPNAPPSVAITSPAEGSTFTAGQTVTIQASATDDNRVAKVEFFANGNSVGADSSSPYSIMFNNLAAGNYALTATAFDDQGLSGTSSPINISVREAPTAPTILLQPQSREALPGANVIFNVTAGGASPFSYQWQYNGINIPGAISDLFELRNVRTNDSGVYRVIVSNEAGSTSSAQAILTVTPAPNVFPTVTVTRPANGARFRSGSTVVVRADPKDTDGFIAQLDFFLNSSLAGSLANAPYEIALSELAPGTYSLTARATDDAGATSGSSAVTFALLDPPGITITQPAENQRFVLGTNLLITTALDAPGLDATRVQIFEELANGAFAISPALTNAPYHFLWTPTAAGTHTLFAVVTDELGGTNVSMTMGIQVIESGSQNPTIAITSSPQNLTRLTNAMVQITGSAHDDIAVERVEFQLNEGKFFPAIGTTDWSAEVSLSAGINVINFRSVDFAGNISSNATRTFTYVVKSVLSVEVRGAGTISPNLNRRPLEIGKIYQMVARPARGQTFGGWEGVAVSNKAILNFSMRSNLSLTAHFIPNRFSKGIYSGVIFEADGARAESSGFVKLNLTQNGNFSGKITIAGRMFPIRGAFDFLGRAEIPVLRRPMVPVVVTLQLDLDQLTEITGEVTDGHWTSSLAAARVLDAATTRARVE
ncbi:MAG: Ig-like domain-containing protein, partial [Verrucomicrobiota bacterium]